MDEYEIFYVQLAVGRHFSISMSRSTEWVCINIYFDAGNKKRARPKRILVGTVV
jgi:hypothetical protein